MATRLIALSGLALVLLASCQSIQHSAFKKVYQDVNKSGSNYTILKVPGYLPKEDSATVEVWVMNTEGMKIAKKQSLLAINKKDSIRFDQLKKGNYKFELAPGKYQFQALINYVPAGIITTKNIKVKAGDYFRVVMLFVEDWESVEVLEENWREDSNKRLKEIDGKKND